MARGRERKGSEEDGLTPGLHERLITAGLESCLQENKQVQVKEVDAADGTDYLATYLHASVRQALQAVSGKGKEQLAGQVALTNRIVAHLAREVADALGHGLEEIVDPARLLLAVARADQPGMASEVFPERPGIPLSQSDLLVNARDERGVGAEIKKEIASADRIDLV